MATKMELDSLIAKAKGSVNALRVIASTDKGMPTEQLGADYNALRELTMKLIPEVSPFLPPKVGIFESPSGFRESEEPYKSLLVFYSQFL